MLTVPKYWAFTSGGCGGVQSTTGIPFLLKKFWNGFRRLHFGMSVTGGVFGAPATVSSKLISRLPDRVWNEWSPDVFVAPITEIVM